jgi:hypothetical protein
LIASSSTLENPRPEPAHLIDRGKALQKIAAGKMQLVRGESSMRGQQPATQGGNQT